MFSGLLCLLFYLSSASFFVEAALTLEIMSILGIVGLIFMALIETISFDRFLQKNPAYKRELIERDAQSSSPEN
jgi:uncharacterized membrane protein